MPQPKSMVVPDFSSLVRIRQDLTEIGIINLQTSLQYLRRYLDKPEVMAIPSVKHLFWVLSMGWEIRCPIVLFTEHHRGEDCLAYIAFEGEGHQKHVIFGDQVYGPYQFASLDRKSQFLQFKIWRDREMYFLLPDIRGRVLEEHKPEDN